jgi:hypothetical protein
MLLETYKNPSVLTKSIRETITRMLEINIDDLKRVLQDVEQCEDQYEKGYSAGYDVAILNERG